MRQLSLIALVCLVGMSLASTAQAEKYVCDISGTRCAINPGGKCNIHFYNRTAKESGLGGPTALKQDGLAQTIKVRALKDNGNVAGNALKIDSGRSKTMNIEKKVGYDFAKIRISSDSDKLVESITMKCDVVIAVLEGNGTCTIFNGKKGDKNTNYLGYNCADGTVVGPE